VHTILEKIERADIFVCDVSITNNNVEGKKTPNPNVLVELGYAMGRLGLSRIIMVMNTAYGGPDDLPFDLRTKRQTTYSLAPSQEKKAERTKLANTLTEAVRTILEARNMTEIVERRILTAIQQLTREQGEWGPDGATLTKVAEAVEMTQEALEDHLYFLEEEKQVRSWRSMDRTVGYAQLLPRGQLTLKPATQSELDQVFTVMAQLMIRDRPQVNPVYRAFKRQVVERISTIDADRIHALLLILQDSDLIMFHEENGWMELTAKGRRKLRQLLPHQ
jgi:hypothetical protein